MNATRWIILNNSKFCKQCLTKYSTLSQHSTNHCRQNIVNLPRYMPTVQFVHQAVTPIGNNVDLKEESLLSKVVKKIPFFNVHKNRLKMNGYMLYEAVVDKINYAEFFEQFSLPDTFYSWFAVTELHLWMLAVRSMAEGDDGRIVRNSLVQALWADVGMRIKKLGVVNTTQTRTEICELSEQFQAALIAYDEGLQSSDVVLAGALWRRLYQQKEVDPEHLDILVKYIRKQMRVLEHLPREDFFARKLIAFGG